MENAAFVCVTEFWPGLPTVSSKRTDSLHTALLASSGALLLPRGHGCRVGPQIFLMALSLWDGPLGCLAQ